MSDPYDHSTPSGERPPSQEGDTTPSSDLPDVPRPFAEEPKRVSGEGCGKIALLGCGGLILLFGIAMVLFAMNVQDVMIWVMNRFEAQIEQSLPEDLPAEERERLHAAFDAFEEAVAEGRVDQSSLTVLQGKIMEMSDDAGTGLTREQVRELTLSLEEAAGVEREGRPEEGIPPPSEEDPEES